VERLRRISPLRVASPRGVPNNRHMTKKFPVGKAAIAGAVGSAAVAAALLYVNRRKDQKNKPAQPGPIPSGEPPETD